MDELANSLDVPLLQGEILSLAEVREKHQAVIEKLNKESKMEKFIGVKIIRATPMTRECAKANYNVVCGGLRSGAGYLVEYEGGHMSWSPDDVFDKAYRRTDNMPFSLAIEAMRLGQRVARKGWNGKGIFCALHAPTAHSKMTALYAYIDTTGLQIDNPDAPKCVAPWLPSQTDMFADDWQVV